MGALNPIRYLILTHGKHNATEVSVLTELWAMLYSLRVVIDSATADQITLWSLNR